MCGKRSMTHYVQLHTSERFKNFLKSGQFLKLEGARALLSLPAATISHEMYGWYFCIELPGDIRYHIPWNLRPLYDTYRSPCVVVEMTTSHPRKYTLHNLNANIQVTVDHNEMAYWAAKHQWVVLNTPAYLSLCKRNDIRIVEYGGYNIGGDEKSAHPSWFKIMIPSTPPQYHYLPMWCRNHGFYDQVNRIVVNNLNDNMCEIYTTSHPLRTCQQPARTPFNFKTLRPEQRKKLRVRTQDILFIRYFKDLNAMQVIYKQDPFVSYYEPITSYKWIIGRKSHQDQRQTQDSQPKPPSYDPPFMKKRKRHCEHRHAMIPTGKRQKV
jgi:hypothetical protein